MADAHDLVLTGLLRFDGDALAIEALYASAEHGAETPVAQEA